MAGFHAVAVALLASGCGRIGFDPTTATTDGPPPTGPMLVGGFVKQTADVDLSAMGTADWSHWGLTNSDSFDHKAGGGRVTMETTANLVRYTNNGFSFSWSDGEPTASVVDTLTGVSVGDVGEQIEIHAPANTAERTLSIFTDVFRATGTVSARLSDNSAPPFTDTTFDTTGIEIRIYSFRYRADSNAQSIVVTLTLDSTTEGQSNLAVPAAILTSP